MASPDLAAAIASLLNDDQDRILSLASSLRAPGRTIESTVKGNSMGPGLPPGSRIRIDMSPASEHRVGDVVAFVGGPQVVVHRIVHAGPEYFLTRGDALVSPDRPIRRDQVVGRVVAMARGREWGALEPPARRGAAATACAPVVLAVARLLLRVGPGVAGAAVRMFHLIEGRTHVVRGRPTPGPR